MKLFAGLACPVSGRGVRWAGLAGHLLPSLDRGVSGHFAHGPICPPDATGLAEEVCLACMPGFRVGGALGGPG
eukprot:1138728-Pelagomonas_calceolata.AAC.3